MESLRQIGAGFLLSLLSITVVIGGFSLSQAEGGVEVIAPSASVIPSAITVLILPTIPILTNTPISLIPVFSTETSAPTFTESPSLTPPPPPASCLPPSGWQAIQVQAYETLGSLAQKYQTSVDLIKQGNCLFSDQLVFGSFLYVPPRPTATFVPCGAPMSWVYYFVVPGDTLYNIGLRYRVSVPELQRANCLGASTFLQAGSRIKVPNVLPLLSATPFYPTASPSPTLVPPSATLVPTTVPPTPIPPTEVPPTVTLPPSATAVPPTFTPYPTDASPVPSQIPGTGVGGS